MREKKGRVLMNGKSKCKILKDIRRQIAADNDIEFVTAECKYQGDCAGTCPKCEAEVRYLEQELVKRQKAGKAVAVAGIAAAIVVSTAGCLPSTTMGDMAPPQSTSATDKVPTSTGHDIPVPPGGIEYVEPTEGELMGEPLPAPTGDEVPPTLMGVPADPDLWD
jgi:hypothetical protein